jgi:hypothetical protein
VWSIVDFGKWAGKGKTLPQIILSDPDWFFWAVENGAFKGILAGEAQKLARRAAGIKLPPPKAATHCIQHWISPDGKYARFDVIEKDQPDHHGSSTEIRRDSLHLGFPRGMKQYDKLGCRLMTDSLKRHWFKGARLTKAKVEANFSTP